MIDDLIRGMSTTSMETLDQFITDEVTNHLFEDKATPYSGKKPNRYPHLCTMCNGAFWSLGAHFLASLHKIPYIDLTFEILFFCQVD